MRTNNGTHVSVYLSKQEKAELDEAVAKSGQSRNSWLRSLIMQTVRRKR